VNKIFRLAFANIRKTKGNSISLFNLFLIAALLLNAGLLIFLNFGGFFDKTTKELNTSNVYYLLSSHLYNDEVEALIKENVIEMQKEESIWVKAFVKYNDETREHIFLINDADEARVMSKWKFVGDYLPPDEMSIFIPYIYQQDGGYDLNDPFKMTIEDIEFTFTIKGFTEDVNFSSTETALMGVYLPHDTYELVSKELDDTNNVTIIFANLQNVNKDIEIGIKELTNAELLSTSLDLSNSLFSLELSIIKMSRVMMASMVSVIIVAFAIIVVSVCLLVIRFRIGDSIEDDMMKIGSLKAIGYTSRQIILSIVMQFFLIAFIGSIVGISLSYLTTPILSDVFAQQSGLLWSQGFDVIISSITLGVILSIVLIVAFFTSRSINKLNPIVALRGGLITHSFRKNYLPLSTSKGRLPIVLAFKSILFNMKQSIMITMIIIAVAFAGTFAVVMFYNTTIDITTFKETPGIELSNVIAILNPDTDNTLLIESIKDMDTVRKVQFIDYVNVKIDNNEVTAFVMSDYSKKETDTIYQGRYPLHSNEIAIAGHLAAMINKNIGDSITLKIGNNQDEYIITGLTQGAFASGMNASIRYDGVIKLDPNFKQQSLQIYLDKNVNAEVFSKNLEALNDESVTSVIDLDKNMELGTSLYTSIISKVGISILTLTIAIIILVLYFVINSSVIRKRCELGIQKAIGFTTFQLMNQISLGFTLQIIVGVIIGSVLAINQTNAIMSIAQRSMGIMKANYIITPIWIILFGVAIIIVSYLTSMLLTYRIRKISAYSLVSE